MTDRHRTPAAATGGGQRILITGGAGFIGTNVADRLARRGDEVIIFDNLSRAGVERNLAWLKAAHGDRITVAVGDVRDAEAVRDAVRRTTQVFHFAAQVAVTTSIVEPRHDFAVNAVGTLNVLEAVRACPTPPSLVFTSTNKVYGALEDLDFVAGETRYAPRAGTSYAQGVGENRALDFHSPYGCSKGAADQYVIDYARSYGLSTAVFRMSCIYGPHQFGTEDQGWVAHFLIRALAGQPITLYGDGRQVRDILFVDDLVDALLLAQEGMPLIRGEAFNIGGGSANTTSLLDLLALIGEIHGERPRTTFGPWRTGDQRFYVSDHGKFSRATGWQPRMPVRDGVAALYRWLVANRGGTASRPTFAVAAEPSAKRRAAREPAAILDSADART